MALLKEFMKIKRKQLELEELQTDILLDIQFKLKQIREMLEVKAVVKRRGGQIFKK